MDNNRDYRVLELSKVLEMLAAKCSCADTAEMARQIEPQSDINKVHEMLMQTSDAHMLAGRFGTPSFGGVSNVANPLRRAQSGAVLSMSELLRVASVLRMVRMLREWRSHCEGVSTSLDGLFMTLAPHRSLEDKITTSILSEDEMSDRASSELFDIRRKIKSAEIRVREQLDKMIRSATYQKYLQDALVTMRDGRFVVPVKAEFRGQVAGLVH
ncbi:MAG: endonuclease MutS2, partial [Acutalibacteraceae bacterium]